MKIDYNLSNHVIDSIKNNVPSFNVIEEELNRDNNIDININYNNIKELKITVWNMDKNIKNTPYLRFKLVSLTPAFINLDGNYEYVLYFILLIIALIIYKHFKYLLHLFIYLLTLLNNMINTAIKRLNRVYNKNLAITAVIKTDDERCIEYILTNDNLLTHKDSLKAIYQTLMSDETFINFGKYKVIFVTALINEQEFNFHHNILITNNTSFEQYYEKVKDIINVHFDHGYQVDVVQIFQILVWNMDSLANKHIKITSNIVKFYKPGFQHNKIKMKNRGFKTSALIYKSINLSQTHFTIILFL